MTGAPLDDASLPRDNGELVFEAPWQARALAIAVTLVRRAKTRRELRAGPDQIRSGSDGAGPDQASAAPARRMTRSSHGLRARSSEGSG